MTLDLGPGKNVQPHFSQPVVRLDCRADIRVDCVADVRSIPFPDEHFDVVYSSHVLEHFKKEESLPLLTEWTRVLKPSGELQLFVPNLEWAALQIVHGICDEFVLNCIFGRQEYPEDYHHTGFTPDRIKHLLSQLPIERYDLRTFRNSICVWAIKSKLSS